MTFKKLFIAASILAAGTLSGAASDIIVDNAPGTADGTPNGFSYIGKGFSNDHYSAPWDPGQYDIFNMEVSRSDAGIMTIRINTEIVEIVSSVYDFGDLFMSTTGWNPTGSAVDGYQGDSAFTSNTNWDYVYSLNGASGLTGNTTDNTSAELHKLKDYDLKTGNIYHPTADYNNFEYGSARKTNPWGWGYEEHLYAAKNSAYDGAEFNSGGSVEVNAAGGYLEFIFDVSGTELATADQIAFHWTVACANDIIEGVVDFANDVPEPAALGLLLLGLTGVGFARRRKQVA